MSNFLLIVGHVSGFIGIVGAVFSVMIWFKIKHQNRKIIELARKTPDKNDFKNISEYHKEIHTSNPYAFCLSLTDRSESIKKDVENFLILKKWEKKMKIEELNYNNLTHENFDNFINELKIKRREFSAKGATEIHLFISGPMQAAAMIGSIFSNWIPVKLYNFEPQEREYRYWCHLAK
jgi:hypothetical protein